MGLFGVVYQRGPFIFITFTLERANESVRTRSELKCLWMGYT